MAQKIIDVDASRPIESTVAELQLPALPLIVLLSDFDKKLNDQVRSICSRVIAPAALDPGALILDNAHCTGCAGLMARAALEQDKMPTLLGVVPCDMGGADIDGDHQVILRLPSAWSDSAKYTFQIADELIKDGTSLKPAIAVLFGGSDAEKKALVRCARRGWPALVIKGTGGLADQILNAQGSQSSTDLADPELKEIVETANIYPSSIDSSVDDLNRILLARIDQRPETVESTLKQAWLRFDELDLTAGGEAGKISDCGNGVDHAGRSGVAIGDLNYQQRRECVDQAVGAHTGPAGGNVALASAADPYYHLHHRRL